MPLRFLDGLWLVWKNSSNRNLFKTTILIRNFIFSSFRFAFFITTPKKHVISPENLYIL